MTSQTGRKVPRVLSIAGTDPTGGAGVQADLKTVGALGGYGMAVVTALVAQNTEGVRSVHVPPPSFLAEQLDAVSDDVAIDAVKIGMLHSEPLVAVVDAWLARVAPPVVVLDPVMVSTSGHRLLDAEAEAAVRLLCRRVHLVTPNLAELAVLVSAPVAGTWDGALGQARSFVAEHGTPVLLKGGHLAGRDCPDAVVTADAVHEVPGVRVGTRHSHGTGCSLSSAMAVLAGTGLAWPEALVRAKRWLTGALEHADALEVGRGRGPVDHFHELRPHLVGVPAPGTSWTASAWERTARVREAAEACAFVAGLRSGTAPLGDFHWYLAQDAQYLREYSRALARASAMAPTADEQVFWARGAATAIEVESELHRTRAEEDPAAGEVEPAATTLAYTDHLLAAAGTGSYAVLVAALLPCFWLYSDLGERLAGASRADHPYRDWLAAYADPAFAASTRTAVEVVEAAAQEAGPRERTRMATAFDRSMQLELDFFRAPSTPR